MAASIQANQQWRDTIFDGLYAVWDDVDHLLLSDTQLTEIAGKSRGRVRSMKARLRTPTKRALNHVPNESSAIEAACS